MKRRPTTSTASERAGLDRHHWRSCEANINLGHLYRDFSYDGKPYDDGTSYGNYNGADYNLRPNHDFLEDKLWFEMAETRK